MTSNNLVIFTYTRAQAIADGVLIDVSKLAREASFRYPVVPDYRCLGRVCRGTRVCGRTRRDGTPLGHPHYAPLRHPCGQKGDGERIDFAAPCP